MIACDLMRAAAPTAPRKQAGSTLIRRWWWVASHPGARRSFRAARGTGPRFYTSFAMHVDTQGGERTLQGEGLKDAIAAARCEVGRRRIGFAPGEDQGAGIR